LTVDKFKFEAKGPSKKYWRNGRDYGIQCLYTARRI